MNPNLIPIFICVVLPVTVILINAVVKVLHDRMQTKVLLKALETNNEINAEKLSEAFSKPQKTEREILNLRLLRGCLFGFVGIALIIVGIVSLCNGTAFNADPVTVPLVFGGASLAVGLSYLVVYFVTRKQIKD